MTQPSAEFDEEAPVATRVPIIEDDALVGAAVTMTLKRERHVAVHALYADTAIEAFESSSFDLALVDIFIPGNNRIELLAGFKKHAPAVPLMTAVHATLDRPLPLTTVPESQTTVRNSHDEARDPSIQHSGLFLSS